MNDRELLESAAKAVGMSGTTVDYDDRLVFLEDGKPASLEWNPLTDDGDALRLAVKLRMLVDADGSVYAVATARPKGTDVMVHEKHRDDPYAAVRRAIVRAAAEIGRTTP